MNMCKITMAAVSRLFALAALCVGSAAGESAWSVADVVPVKSSLRAVCFGESLFVAVGDAGTILTSPDGRRWTTRSSETTQNLHGVAFANGVYIAGGDSGVLSFSEDGKKWKCDWASKLVNIDHMCSCDGMLYAFGNEWHYDDWDELWYPYGVSFSSENGQSWSGAQWEKVFQVVKGAGKWVRIESDYADYIKTFLNTSSDDSVWTSFQTSIATSLESVAFGDGRFIAVGNRCVATSTDGLAWVERTTSRALHSIIHDADGFVAVGDSGEISTTTDGQTGYSAESPTRANLRSIVSGTSTRVAVGDSGVILWSLIKGSGGGNSPPMQESGQSVGRSPAGISLVNNVLTVEGRFLDAEITTLVYALNGAMVKKIVSRSTGSPVAIVPGPLANGTYIVQCLERGQIIGSVRHIVDK